MAIRMQVRNERISYPYVSGIALISYNPSNQLNPKSIGLCNDSASAMDLGFGISFPSSQSSIYISLAASPTVATALAPASPFFSNSNDRIYIQTKGTSGLVSFKLSTLAGTGGVYTYEYWNGTSWSTLPVSNAPDFTASDTALAFSIPQDMAVGTGGITGLNSNLYSIRITATTAPSIAPQYSSYMGVKLISMRRSVGAGEFVTWTFEEDQYLLDSGQNIIPYFGTASSSNVVEFAYKLSP